MANYVVSGEKLTNIAQAIRNKLNNTSTYTVDDMATVISNNLIGQKSKCTFVHPDVTIDSITGCITIDTSNLVFFSSDTGTEFVVNDVFDIMAIKGDVEITDSNRSILDPSNTGMVYYPVVIIFWQDDACSGTYFDHYGPFIYQQQLVFSASDNILAVRIAAIDGADYLGTIKNVTIHAMCHR